MADPTERRRFVSRHKNEPVREVSFANALTGESVTVEFTNGSFETTDPGLIPGLAALAASAGHPFKEEPASAAPTKGSAKKGA